MGVGGREEIPSGIENFKIMRTLVYATCGFADPSLAILLDAADRAHLAGEDVFFAHCSGASHLCFDNPSGNPLLCKLCRHCVSRYVKDRREWLKVIPIDLTAPIHAETFDYSTVAELKKVAYRGCSIGYGVLSMYISLTRDCFPDFSNQKLKGYFDGLLLEAVKISDRAYKCFEEVKPDKLICFNGRLMENRSFHEVAKIKGIPFVSKEVVGSFRSGEAFMSFSFFNVMPHDIPYNTELVQRVWDVPNESVEEKTKKGMDFFERRRRGVVAGDRVYIGNQRRGLLPDGWDNTKRNYVIFNSSEDEFAAIGPEFERYAMFPSQLDGIRYILQHVTDPAIHFYLRIHPNLSRVHYAYRVDLLKLSSQFGNVTVVDADDSCSTYDMMDAAEKIIVFGSTAGAEAAYWGKPVILLAASYYHDLDIAYVPRDQDDLLKLLVNRLPEKNREGAIRYGYFMLNRKLLAERCESFDLTVRSVRVLNKRLPICNYNTLLGSVHLMKYVRLWLKYAFRFLGCRKNGIKYFTDPAFVN